MRETFNISELIGPALDFAVAKCENLPLRFDPMGFRKDAPTSGQAGWWVWDDGKSRYQIIGDQDNGYSPSTNWGQGGPIIEREKLQINCGPITLVSAMQMYVALKLRDSLDEVMGS